MTEERAREILKEYIEGKNLIWNAGTHSKYLNWWAGTDHVVLDDSFSIEELEAIVYWMKTHTIGNSK